MTKSSVALVWVMAILSSTGCGNASRVYEVEGQLLVGGKPASNAAVAFHPLNGTTDSATCPVALTDSNGHFRLSTFSQHDGAPVGDYIVTLIWRDDSIPFDDCECEDPTKHDRLGGRYADIGKSDLRVTVRARQNQIVLKTPAINLEFHNKKPAPKSS